MFNEKTWYKSKILWVQILTALLAVLQLEEVVALLPTSWLPIISAVVTGLLRVFGTSTKLVK
jgi:hypothetical protein